MDPFLTHNLPNTDARPLPIQHQYATRIRQNIVIKPSARLRQSPDPPLPPRKIKPTPSLKPTSIDSIPPNNMPHFPPPHIVLHPDDANSKVFLAIGRSFLSVDNRAMTIKDLAEMTVQFGLVCQNVSAASQAITTYIRTHMQRCDIQQDHPLLLRHVLSGTPSDDDLLPALHSRSGGAHCTVNAENRTTNFRRGTMVWYLSRATGAPCPFARAGIRLCEYGENGKLGLSNLVRERKRERDRQRRAEQCGQKRKRPLRGCVSRGSDSDSPNEDGKPPPKVKLTLRLKPFPSKYASTSANPTPSVSASDPRQVIDISRDSDSDSGDDSMSVDSSDDESCAAEKKPKEEPWSLPPYPRRSISIPCYTPSFGGPDPYFPVTIEEQSNECYRRSPSISYSIASPPPDSEDEDDDYHITMTGVRRYSTDRQRTPATADPNIDFDFDSEGDGETLWESPGPRSPSAPIIPRVAEVAVKQEPRDVQGMLDAWDDIDYLTSDAKVVKVVEQAAAGVVHDGSTGCVKVEELEAWDWGSRYKSVSEEWYSPVLEDEGHTHIKQEDLEFEPSLGSPAISFNPAPSSPLSPLSSISSNFSSLTQSQSPTVDPLRRQNGLMWKDVELGSDFSLPSIDEGQWLDGDNKFATVRPRAHTAPSLSAFTADSTHLSFTSMQPPRLEMPKSLGGPIFSHHDGKSDPLQPSSSTSHSLVSLIQSMSMSSPTAITPSSLWITPPCVSSHGTSREGRSDVVVVHTCQPCTPAISATQVEGISVYQMMLATSSLLRRIDTDFVNISSIVNYLGAPSPSLSLIPNAMVIDKGSPAVIGSWVPLSAAQDFVRTHPTSGGLLDIFLSDVLFERFPSALQDFHKSSTPGRMLNQFGPHFNSTQLALDALTAPISPWEVKQAFDWNNNNRQEEHVLAINQPFALLVPTSMSIPLSPEHEKEAAEPPLSATEQEMFQALCAIQDWEKEETLLQPESVTEDNTVSRSSTTATKGSCQEQPADTEEDIPVSERGAHSPIPDRSDRPLRRSKRVADAIAARSRTRSRRRGSRNCHS